MDLFMSSYSYFSKISRTNPIYNLSIESAGQISQVPIHITLTFTRFTLLRFCWAVWWFEIRLLV